eukprot:7510074-Ditylum_brightwellii.AAC.1
MMWGNNVICFDFACPADPLHVWCHFLGFGDRTTSAAVQWCHGGNDNETMVCHWGLQCWICLWLNTADSNDEDEDEDEDVNGDDDNAYGTNNG